MEAEEPRGEDATADGTTSSPVAGHDVAATTLPGAPAPGTWGHLPADPFPTGFTGTAIWGGDRLYVWGFMPAIDRYHPAGPPAGASWDPVDDAWTMLPEVSDVDGSRPVWSGNELFLPGVEKAGAAYDPREGTWRHLPPPPVRVRHEVVAWTGMELVVWGPVPGTEPGRSGPTMEGAAYDPASDTWRMLPRSPLSGRTEIGWTWTGTEVVVWGGSEQRDRWTFVQLADGAAYNPATNRWRKLAPSPLSARSSRLVWTGREVLVLGGMVDAPEMGFDSLDDSAAYDPATDSWRKIATPGTEAVVLFIDPVWTGRGVIARGYAPGDYALRWVAYDPAAEVWRALPPSPPARFFEGASLMWSGSELLAWGPLWDCHLNCDQSVNVVGSIGLRFTPIDAGG